MFGGDDSKKRGRKEEKAKIMEQKLPSFLPKPISGSSFKT